MLQAGGCRSAGRTRLHCADESRSDSREAGQAAVPEGGASLVLEAVLEALQMATSPKGLNLGKSKSQGEGINARLNSTRYWLD